MTSDPTPAEGEPQPCPRCGHDLRGVAESWRTGCPLDARCPECGLAFRWGDLLRGRLTFPWWCVEGATGPTSWLLRVLPTLLVATLLPRRLLRRLRLEHRWRPGRLLATTVLVLAVAGGVALTLPTITYVRDGMGPLQALAMALQIWDDRATRVVQVPIPRRLSGRVVVVRVDPSGTVQVTIEGAGWFRSVGVVDADTRMPDGSIRFEDASVQYAMLPSANGTEVLVATSFPPLDGPPAPGEHPTVGYQEVFHAFPRSILPAPPGLPASGGIPVAETVSIVPAATVRAVAGLRRVSQRFRPPARILGPTLADARRWLAFVWWPSAIALVGGGLAFVALPVSIRRARVRPRHIVRLSFYAAFAAVTAAVFCVLVAETAAARVDPPAVSSRLGLMRLAMLLGLPSDEGTLLLHLGRWIVLPTLVAGTWWTWAARHHLRMDRPVLIGGSVAAVAMSVGTIATHLVRGIL